MLSSGMEKHFLFKFIFKKAEADRPLNGLQRAHSEKAGVATPVKNKLNFFFILLTQIQTRNNLPVHYGDLLLT